MPAISGSATWGNTAAPFRYPHYHEASDTADKLDYDRMSRVVNSIAKVVAELANK